MTYTSNHIYEVSEGWRTLRCFQRAKRSECALIVMTWLCGYEIFFDAELQSTLFRLEMTPTHFSGSATRSYCSSQELSASIVGKSDTFSLLLFFWRAHVQAMCTSFQIAEIVLPTSFWWILDCWISKKLIGSHAYLCLNFSSVKASYLHLDPYR